MDDDVGNAIYEGLLYCKNQNKRIRVWRRSNGYKFEGAIVSLDTSLLILDDIKLGVISIEIHDIEKIMNAEATV